MRLLLSSACLCLLAACSPQAPDEEQRPQPQADAPADAPATSAIVQQANVYKDAARDAVQQAQDAADRERAAADAAQ